jgi:hypothetical protein
MRSALVLCAALSLVGCRLNAKFHGADAGVPDLSFVPDDLAGLDLIGVDLTTVDLTPGPDMADINSVASFTVTTPTGTSFAEHASFSVEVTAKNVIGATLTSYTGTIAVTTDWGDIAVPTAPAFVNGVADFAVSLNRETNPSNLARVKVADGTALGQTSPLTITTPGWLVDEIGTSASVKSTSTTTNWNYQLVTDTASIAPKTGGYYFYHEGNTSAGTKYGVGQASNAGFGGAWSFSTTPIFQATGAAVWDGTFIGGPLVVKDGATYYMLYKGNGNGAAQGSLGLATSSDGASFTKFGASPVITGSAACDPSFGQMVLQGAGTLRLFTRCTPAKPSISTSTNGGQTWTAMTMMNGLITGGTSLNAIMAAVKEGSVYKIWYTTLAPTENRYATSTDGVTWISSPANPLGTALPNGAVWDAANARMQGMFDCVDSGTGKDAWCRGHRL